MVGKILVAEDDPEARELLLLLLEGGEYSLLEAADGMEALRPAAHRASGSADHRHRHAAHGRL